MSGYTNPGPPFSANQTGLRDITWLRAAVASWLDATGDSDLEPQIDTFIALAEAELSFDSPLRVSQRRVVAPMTNQFEALPVDVVEAQHVFYLGTNCAQDTGSAPLQIVGARRDPLEYMTPEAIARKWGNCTVADNASYAMSAPQGAGRPINYSVFGRQIQFAPCILPGQLPRCYFEIMYWAMVQPLTDKAPVNDLLLKHPSIYLYGALLQAAPFIGSDDRKAVWQQQYQDALAKASNASTRQGRVQMTLG